MLRRLEFGLAGEGVSVIQALPDTATDLSDSGLFAQSVVYPTKSPWFMERWRTRQLLEAIRESDAGMPGADRKIDLVHVFGEGAWGLASRTARELGCPLVVEVWAAELVGRAAAIPNSVREEVPVALLAPDRHIEQALRREDAGLPIRFVAWGVHCPGQVNASPASKHAIGVMVMASSHPNRETLEAFRGICAAAKRQERAMIFADSAGVHESGAWTVVEEVGVLDKVTLVPRMEATRTLVLRGSILVDPEASGQQRTIVLDAMAHGMGVIGLRDPMVSYLRDGQTAVLLGEAGPAEWAAALETLIVDRERAKRLGESAREYVAANHRMSTQVASVLDVYERLLSGETLPFPSPVGAEERGGGR